MSILGPVKILDLTCRICSALETVTFGIGIKKIEYNTFYECSALKVINVPAKKTDYYKKLLPESLHHIIVELPPEKKK